MRGLTSEEYDWLRRSTQPPHLRTHEGSRTIGDTLPERLERRGLVRRDRHYETKGVRYWVSDITPLGRLAMSIHIAAKVMESA